MEECSQLIKISFTRQHLLIFKNKNDPQNENSFCLKELVDGLALVNYSAAKPEKAFIKEEVSTEPFRKLSTWSKLPESQSDSREHLNNAANVHVLTVM